MIVRIMGEGQLELPDSALDDLNAFDRLAELAVDADNESAFAAALVALHDAVRARGVVLAGDVLAPSDVVLPPVGSTVADVRALFDGDGMVPG